MTDALGVQLITQRDDLVDEGFRDRDGLGPAQALRGLRFGLRPPERRVLRRDPAGDPVGHQLGDEPADGLGRRARGDDRDTHFAASSAAVTVSSNSFHDTTNFSTPSFSSTAVTSS